MVPLIRPDSRPVKTGNLPRSAHRAINYFLDFDGSREMEISGSQVHGSVLFDWGKSGVNTRYRSLSSFLKARFSGGFLVDEPLSAHTWYGIGGPADIMVFPRTGKEAAAVLKLCASREIPFVVLGMGANVLVSDAGFRGVVLVLTKYLNAINTENGALEVQAGAALQELVLCAEERGLGGMEYLSGIPGSIGGALTMNAGTDQGAFGDSVDRVYALSDRYELTVIPRAQISFGYRSAPQLQNRLLLGCRLALRPDATANLREIRLSQMSLRAAKQPLECPSCGSVFKRPPGAFVGRLVEEAGLKGVRQGNAMISERHGGFIVNTGGARAEEVMYLIRLVQDTIQRRNGISLEPEVRFIGFDRESVA